MAKAKAKKTKEKKSLLQFDVAIGGPNLAQKALFAKNMSLMLRSGMTLVDALHTVQTSLSGKFRNVLMQVIEKVESGIPLSDSLAAHPKVFPDIFINVTRAGEASGSLPENFENIAKQLKKDKALVSKVRGAMIYPIIILVATFFLGIAIAFFVLPEIVPLFQGLGTDLPFTTRALIAFSNQVDENGFVLFTTILFVFFGSLWLSRQRFARPFTHWLTIKLPIVKNITQHANVARFTNTLGLTMKSGISIDDALMITQGSLNNYYYQKELKEITQQVRAGAQLSDELAQREALFPLLVTRIIKVGEESGKFEDTLLYLADFYEDEVDTAIKNFTTMLEPLLLLFIGGLVGFLALSIISPIYDITGNVQR